MIRPIEYLGSQYPIMIFTHRGEYCGRNDIDGKHIYEGEFVQIGCHKAGFGEIWSAVGKITFERGSFMLLGRPLCVYDDKTLFRVLRDYDENGRRK